MKHRILGGLAVIAALACAPRVPAAGLVDDVLAVDRSFAAAATESGAQAAFMDFLAPDAVLFRPTAVNGRDWLQTHEEASGRLEWSPAAGAVACDGQLAFSVGPWSYRQGTSNSSGTYLTIWRRDAGGDWMVVLDHGIDGPDGASPVKGGALDVLAGRWRSSADNTCGRGGDTADVADADRRLNDAIRSTGADAALRGQVSAAPVIFRDGHVPAVITADWPRDDATFGAGIDAATDGAVAGPGADLGYTYGRIIANDRAGGPAEARAVYVRLWVWTAGQWVLTADMTTVVTAPAPTASSP